MTEILLIPSEAINVIIWYSREVYEIPDYVTKIDWQIYPVCEEFHCNSWIVKFWANMLHAGEVLVKNS